MSVLKRKDKRQENPLFLPKSLKYLNLSKNIKEIGVHVIFKDGPCYLVSSVTQATPCCSPFKIHLSVVSENVFPYFG